MKYFVEHPSGGIVIGELVETRGDDERFPTFLLDDGKYIGVQKDKVLAMLPEDKGE